MFWIDPFLLFGAGLIIALLAKHFFHSGMKETAWVLGASLLVIFVFWFVAIAMFCNFDRELGFAGFKLNDLTQPFYDLVEGPGSSGTAFMLNGGIWDIVPKNATLNDITPGWMFLCILMFCLYPVYLWFGLVLGRMLFGRKPKHLGLLGFHKALEAESYRLP
jgi:hypothetical protein